MRGGAAAASAAKASVRKLVGCIVRERAKRNGKPAR